MEEKERERKIPAPHVPRLYSPPYTQGDRYTQPLKRLRCAALTADTHRRSSPNPPSVLQTRIHTASTQFLHTFCLPSFPSATNDAPTPSAWIRREKVFLHQRRSTKSLWWLNQRQTTLEKVGPIAERGGEMRKREGGEGMVEVVLVCTQLSI